MRTILSIFAVALIFIVATFIFRSRFSTSGVDAPEVVSIAVYSQPQNLHIYKHADLTAYKILKMMHMGLLTENFRGDVYSAAATTWKVNPAGDHYEFTLDTSLRFHNGKPLACADVDATFKHLLLAQKDAPGIDNVKGVTCTDATTFTIDLKKPSTLFLPTLLHLEASIVPADLAAADNSLVGLGPYRLKSGNYTPHDTEVVLERVDGNERLWPQSAKSLRFQYFHDPEAAMTAWEKGSLDLVELLSEFPERAISQAVTSVYMGRVWFLAFGQGGTRPISDDEKRCLYNSLEREHLLEGMGAAGKFFAPAFGVVAPSMRGVYDPRQSADGLTPQKSCASLPPAKVLMMETSQHAPLPTAVLARLNALGWSVTPEYASKPEVIDRLVSRKFDVTLLAFGLDMIPEHSLSYFYSSHTLVPLTGLKDPEIDRRLTEIELSQTEETRATRIFDLERNFAKKPVIIPIAFQKNAYLVRNCLNIENWTTTGAAEDYGTIGVTHGCIP